MKNNNKCKLFCNLLLQHMLNNTRVKYTCVTIRIFYWLFGKIICIIITVYAVIKTKASKIT